LTWIILSIRKTNGTQWKKFLSKIPLLYRNRSLDGCGCVEIALALTHLPIFCGRFQAVATATYTNPLFSGSLTA
jgi:hypothetical protein